MMLLIAAVAQRWCSGGRFRDSAATVDGIRRTMLMIAGMTDRINSRTSSAFGVRATAAGAESWPAGAGAGATAADAGARNCATTIFTPALTTTISPTSARPTRTIIETLDMGTLLPSKLPVQLEVEHLAIENLPAADVHEELPLVGARRRAFGHGGRSGRGCSGQRVRRTRAGENARRKHQKHHGAHPVTSRDSV